MIFLSMISLYSRQQVKYTLPRRIRNTYRCHSLERLHSYINIEQEPNKPFRLRTGRQAGTSGLSIFLCVILSYVDPRHCGRPLLQLQISYTVIRMDRRSFMTYPSISSLDNASVLVSVYEIYYINSVDRAGTAHAAE